MPKASVISLRIDGVKWTHWKTAEVGREVTALAGTFSFSLADPWQEKGGAKSLPIATGMSCEVLVDGVPVITGYVGKASPFFTASSHGITIAGRDKSADMADCAAVHKPGEWQNVTVLQLAKILADPFGVPVTAAGDIGAPIPKFKLEQGESAADALFRALKMRELLATPSGNGGIVLARIGTRRSSTTISQEKNIKESSAAFDEDARFSHYLVQGQQPGSDTVYGEAAAAVSAEVRDPGVVRYRPFIVRAEDSVDAASARRRAEWEKTVRAAKSVSIPVTLQGVHQENGDLWDVNLIVPVDIPFFSVRQDLLVSAVSFTQSPGAGTETRLTLKDPKAYMQEPQKKTAEGSASSGSYTIEKEELLVANRDRAEKSHTAIRKGAK